MKIIYNISVYQNYTNQMKGHKRQRLMTPVQEQVNINTILRGLGFVCMLFPISDDRNSPKLYQHKRSNSF